jgi:AcrR family transcriptional regulator
VWSGREDNVAGDQEPRLRADARRNRDRIVAAAKAWFRTHGPEASVEDIARSAGVAPGTLYRHFADRPTLIHAVALDNLANAVREARAAAAEEPTAWDALVRILRYSYELRLGVQMTMSYPHVRKIMKRDPAADRLRQDMIGVVDGVVNRAQREGSLRTDVGTGDIAVTFLQLARPVPIEKEDLALLASRRCMALLLAGLRAPADDQLPGRPIRHSDLLS